MKILKIDFQSFLYRERAIYKSRNTGTGNRMQGTRGMFTMISGNLLEDSWQCSHFNIPGNAREDSGEVPEDSAECYQRFRGILSKILGSVQEDSGKCSERSRGMFRKIAWNVFNFKLIKT